MQIRVTNANLPGARADAATTTGLGGGRINQFHQKGR